MNSLDQKIDRLSNNPGVYLFKDKKRNILYVGKAGNIKHRVSSYFQKPTGKDLKTLMMLEKVTDIDIIVTDTEKDAFILENNLIKVHHPRYNVKLRDDKNYPCLRLSIGEEFPTLTIVRRIKKDGSLYFGPYPSWQPSQSGVVRILLPSSFSDFQPDLYSSLQGTFSMSGRRGILNIG